MICLPRNKLTKEREKVNINIIETYGHMVDPSDKPVCMVTPAASTSIDVISNSRIR